MIKGGAQPNHRRATHEVVRLRYPRGKELERYKRYLTYYGSLRGPGCVCTISSSNSRKVCQTAVAIVSPARSSRVLSGPMEDARSSASSHYCQHPKHCCRDRYALIAIFFSSLRINSVTQVFSTLLIADVTLLSGSNIDSVVTPTRLSYTKEDARHHRQCSISLSAGIFRARVSQLLLVTQRSRLDP